MLSYENRDLIKELCETTNQINILTTSLLKDKLLLLDLKAKEKILQNKILKITDEYKDAVDL